MSLWLPLFSQSAESAYLRINPLRRSNRLRQEPAIDAEVDAGDEAAGPAAGQEHGGTDQLAPLAEAGHRRVAENRLGAGRRRAVGVVEQRAVLLGGEEAGRDRVHAHALRRPLAGEEL